MKNISALIFLFILCTQFFGQKIHVINKGDNSDSSFYHIEKINDNEFWAGGEFGVLKKIDTIGNISCLNYPNEGLSILKILKKETNIYIVTDNAIIYKYNIQDKKFIKKIFPNYDNKCFYDIISLKDGNLMVCGGSSGISQGIKRIPNGFIAIIDDNLQEITTVWKNYRKMVWAIFELEDGSILASTFNGLNSTIIKSDNKKNWDNFSKVKGMVHEIGILDNDIWYSGSRNLNHRKNGILQKDKEEQVVLKKTGCIWCMDEIKNMNIFLSGNNKLITQDKTTSEINQIDTPPYTFYDITKISESKILIVGHGKGINIIDF